MPVVKALFATILVMVVLAAASPARSQLADPVTGRNVDFNTWSNSNALLNQQQNFFALQRMGLLLVGKEMVERQRLLQTVLPRGLRVIKSGKATTRFTPVAATIAPQHFAGLQGQTADERRRLAGEFGRALQTFRQEAKARGLVHHDLAHVLGLAFVLSYETYSGGKTNARQQAGITSAFRTFLLRDALHQGMDNRAKQLLAERRAIDAAAARALLRENKRQQAQTVAQNNLAAYWGGPVEGIELTPNGFGDRGKRLVREGKATTRFRPVSGPVAPAEMARADLYTLTPKDKLEAYYNDCLRRFDGELKKRGGTPNDLADAMTAAVALNWEAYDRGRKLTQPQYNGVMREMRKDVLSPNWQARRDETKQRTYETIAIKAVAARDEAGRAANDHGPSLPASDDPLVKMANETARQYAAQAQKSAVVAARTKAYANLTEL